MKIGDSNAHTYSYDKLYQLIFVNYNDGNMTNYYYDLLGNRTSVTNGQSTSYSSNCLNQYDSVNSVAYSYDKNGNLTNDGTYKYYYDCENRLTDVNTISDEAVAHYAYDYLGRRISKTDYTLFPARYTLFCYDGDNLIAEYDSSNNLLKKYIYGGNIDEPICMMNENTYYYHFDGLGSIVALSNGSGQMIEKYNYDAFGQSNATSTIGNRFFFTGREYEPEIGLYYYRARYYKQAGRC